MFSKLLQHLDFNKLEARNMVLAVLGSAPASPVMGQCYYDSALGGPRWYDGTSAWTNKATDSALLNGQNAAFYLARANHTGTQTAATISDLASVVQSYTVSTSSRHRLPQYRSAARKARTRQIRPTHRTARPRPMSMLQCRAPQRASTASRASGRWPPPT
jgi:hypothetical protein